MSRVSVSIMSILYMSWWQPKIAINVFILCSIFLLSRVCVLINNAQSQLTNLEMEDRLKTKQGTTQWYPKKNWKNIFFVYMNPTPTGLYHIYTDRMHEYDSALFSVPDFVWFVFKLLQKCVLSCANNVLSVMFHRMSVQSNKHSLYYINENVFQHLIVFYIYLFNLPQPDFSGHVLCVPYTNNTVIYYSVFSKNIW